MSTLTDILPLLTSGGILGGIASFVLLGPRLRQMRVKSDGEVVDKALDLLTAVKSELERANKRVTELEKQVLDVQALHRRIADLESQLDTALQENAALRKRKPA